MGGSLTHADVNCVFSLFAFFAIYTHVQYNSIREVLVILVAVSIVVLLSDLWALVILGRQPLGEGSKILGYIFVALEVGLKILLIIYLGIWRQHIAEEDDKKNID